MSQKLSLKLDVIFCHPELPMHCQTKTSKYLVFVTAIAIVRVLRIGLIAKNRLQTCRVEIEVTYSYVSRERDRPITHRLTP